MKRYLLFFCMIVITIRTAASEECASLYQQGAYQELVDTYASKNDNNAATWCMLGNAAFCLQQYTQAYLYWLRAQRYGNAHTYYISTQNIDTLQQQGFVQPQHKVYTWLIWLSKYVGIYTFQLFFLLVWYALCMMLYKRKGSLLAVGGVALSACCLLMPVIAAYHFHRQRGLIMENTTIYNGPNRAYYNVGSVPKGALIYVENVQDDWIKIIYNDTIGWIGRTDVGLLTTRGFETKASDTSSFYKEK